MQFVTDCFLDEVSSVKNRATFLICICLLLILLSGCGIKKTYRYMYEKSRIVGIDIVYVGDSVDDYVFEVEKVKTVFLF